MATRLVPSIFSATLRSLAARSSMAMVGLVSSSLKTLTPFSLTKRFNFISLSTTRKPLTKSFHEPFWQSLLLANASFSRSNFCKREIQTKTQPTSHVNEDLENHETGTLKPDCDSVNAPSNINSISFGTVSEYSATSNLKTSPRHNLAMIFTCNVCETRSVKTVCRESYEKGVVVARCGGCNNLHLMADHLGWFGRPGSVEEFLAARGEEVKKGSIDTLNLTPDDLAGWKS